MRPDFVEQLNRSMEKGEAFCVATIIQVEGSASAKCGSKAIFSSSGQNIFGWVGGALEVVDKLGLAGIVDCELPLFVPAGLDIDARTPEEIALSIVTELSMLGGQRCA